MSTYIRAVVAAESRRKAKSMYCDYCDSLLDFIMVHTYIIILQKATLEVTI